MNKLILVMGIGLNMTSVFHASVSAEGPKTQPKVMDSVGSYLGGASAPILERQNAVADLSSQNLNGDSVATTVLVSQGSDFSWIGSQNSRYIPAEGTTENPIDVG